MAIFRICALINVQDCSLNFDSKDCETKFEAITNNLILKKELTDTRVFNARVKGVVQQHTEKLFEIDDKSNRNNLRIDGLSENERETPEITEEKVKFCSNNN